MGRRRGGPAASGPVGSPRRRRPDRREPRRAGRGAHPGHTGGDLVGPTPTDRGHPGPTRHRGGDRAGIPLPRLRTGATRTAAGVCAHLRDAVPAIPQPTGRRRPRPATRHADPASAMPRGRQALPRRHLPVRIARNGIASSQRRGRQRGVLARTLAGLTRCRRVTSRDDRCADIPQACLTRGGCRICFTTLHKAF